MFFKIMLLNQLLGFPHGRVDKKPLSELSWCVNSLKVIMFLYVLMCLKVCCTACWDHSRCIVSNRFSRDGGS